MLHTRICDVLGITHPIVLGGLGGGHTSAPLVAAVSNAGGFGTLGVTGFSAASVQEQIAAIRAATDKPFGVNFLLFLIQEAALTAALESRPPVVSFAWARPDQDLRPYVQRVHDAGSLVMHMAGEVPEAVRAAKAGADVIVAQGTEGGGHVGWMATMALVPMVVQAVAPVPVLAAGGIADGRGLAAALALGADGLVIGTRFLATDVESFLARADRGPDCDRPVASLRTRNRHSRIRRSEAGKRRTSRGHRQSSGTEYVCLPWFISGGP
jgi:NAD(P)H-dependent flavin oxidoreductase YrpB (nitropropane dioxygenase family)